MGKLRKITTNGRSPSVTLPKDYLEEHSLALGDHVDLSTTDSAIIIRPVGVRESSGAAESS